MAGTISLSLSQQFDSQGVPLSGGLLYFYEAATTNPQSAYQDQALTITYPNPIVLDASGRVPAFYLADGNIKIRLTDDSGVTIIAADNLLVVGPSSGGPGGGGADPRTVLATGDIKARFSLSSATLDGFVRCNGRTIGATLSSATELASPDCQELFEYLWGTGVLSVEPSRGATANADWLASRRIVLPDLRGRTIAGLDDMGAAAAGRLTESYFGVLGTTLGAASGSESQPIALGNLPDHVHDNSLIDPTHSHTVIDPTHSHTVSDPQHFHLQTGHTTLGGITGGGGAVSQDGLAANTGSASTGITIAAASTGVTNQFSATDLEISNGGVTGAVAAPFNIVQPTLVLMFYIKL